MLLPMENYIKLVFRLTWALARQLYRDMLLLMAKKCLKLIKFYKNSNQGRLNLANILYSYQASDVIGWM